MLCSCSRWHFQPPPCISAFPALCLGLNEENRFPLMLKCIYYFPLDCSCEGLEKPGDGTEWVLLLKT